MQSVLFCLIKEFLFLFGREIAPFPDLKISQFNVHEPDALKLCDTVSQMLAHAPDLAVHSLS